MEYPSISSQPTINVCSKIRCPFFNQPPLTDSCTKYPNSCCCHLTSVFAFQADGHWLFVVDEQELLYIKKVNDSWISYNKTDSGRQKHSPRGDMAIQDRVKKSQQCETPIHYPSILNSSFGNFCSLDDECTPISINLLNSIQFEDY